MPELGAGPGRAAKRLAVEDEPTADAGSEGQQHQVVRAAPGPDLPLCDRRRVPVVVDRRRKAEALGHPVTDVQVGERDVHGGHDATGPLVDRGRQAEAESGSSPVVHFPDQVVQIREELLLRAPLGLARQGALDAPVFMDERRVHLRAADVDADHGGTGHAATIRRR